MNTKYLPFVGRIEVARRSLTAGLGALLVAPGLLGQDNTEAEEPVQLNEVRVTTGSNIPTAESETASPLRVYTAADIQKLGVTDVNALVQRLPISNFGGLNGNNGGTGFASGGTGTSLRGLGLNATLVLLNGRRMPLYGFADGGTSSFVDLNSIPLAAVETVEILREGASAIYGADAIAGVINVKTKRNFDGLYLLTRYGNTFTTDIGEQLYQITYGTHSKDDKTSILMVADFLSRNDQFNRDRAFSSQVDLTPFGGVNNGSSFGYPGRFTVPRNAPGLVGTPFEGATGTRTLVPPRTTNGRAAPGDYHLFGDDDRFNYLQRSQASPASKRYGVLGTVAHQVFDEKLELFTTVAARRGEEHLELAPTPVDLGGNGIPLGEVRVVNGVKTVGTQLTIPANNPFNPFGVDINGGRYRFAEAGNRITDVESHTYLFTAGLRGTLDPRFNYETAVNFGRNESTKKNLGTGINEIQRALRDTDPATSFNIFNGPSSPNPATVLDPLLIRFNQLGRYETFGWDGKMNGLFDGILPGGAIGYNIGTEYRTESYLDDPDSIQRNGGVAGQVALKGNSGSRDITAAFAEALIPITGPGWNLPGIYRLDINAAGRIDSYSDFGDGSVPMVKIAWRPINEDFLIRGTYGQSFRPASLQQVFQSPSDALTGTFTDPLRDEVVREIPIVRGGNLNLKPETSDNWSVGGVWTPSKWIQGFRAEAQYFKIKRRDEIGSFSDFFGNGDLAQRPGGYVRGPYDGLPEAQIDPATGLKAGPLISLNDQFQNLGSTVSEYLDGGLQYELKTQTAGTWTFQAEATYLLSYEASPGLDPATNEQAPFESYEGTTSASDAFPRLKILAGISWGYKNLTLSTVANFRSSVNYFNPVTDEPAKVSSFMTHDIRAAYKFPKAFTLAVGILNLMDEDPPLYVGLSNNAFAYLSDQDTPFGRQFYIELSKKF